MHKIDSFKHSWLFHKKEFSPPFKWSGKLSWSHFHFTDMGIITQKPGSIVSSQPRTSSQWIDVFTNTPLIFLKLSHTLIAFILSLCIFFPSPAPFSHHPQYKVKRRRKWSHPGCWSPRTGEPWTWMNPSKWNQVETWRCKTCGIGHTMALWTRLLRYLTRRA